MSSVWGRRLTRTVAALALVLLATFFLAHITPGDPIRALLGPQASQQAVDAMRAELGLNQPLIAQLLSYVSGIFQGDFGTSIATRQPVSDLMLSRMAPTLLLVVYAAVIA